MKKTFLLLGCLTVLAMTAFISGCKKNNDDKKDEIPTSAFDGFINANVENGNAYNALVKRVVAPYAEEKICDTIGCDWVWVYASGKYENGGFMVTLPNSVDDKYLELISEDMPEGINVSDRTAKLTEAGFRGISSATGDWDWDNVVGGFWYGREDERADAFPMYANKDVTITGVFEEEGDGEKYRYEYNVSLKKGWNWLYFTEEEKGGKWVYTYSTQAVSGLKWYFEPWDEDDYSRKTKKSRTKFPKTLFGK